MGPYDLQVSIQKWLMKKFFQMFKLTDKFLLWGILNFTVFGIIVVSLGKGKPVFNPRGIFLFSQFFFAALKPALEPSFLIIVIQAALLTICFSVSSTIISMLIGFTYGIISSEFFTSNIICGWFSGNWPLRFFLPLSRIVGSVFRGVHELIWGLLFINIFGLSPITAILGIAIPYGFVTAKVYSEFIDTASRKEFFSLVHAGVSPLVSFFYTVIPNVSSSLKSYILYRLDSSLRSATVMGMIGGGGIGYQILLSFQSLRFDELWTLFYALMILSVLMDSISSFNMTNFRNFVSKKIQIRNTYPSKRSFSIALRNGGNLLLISFLFLGSLRFSLPHPATLFSQKSLKNIEYLLQSSFPIEMSPQKLILLSGLSLETLFMAYLAIMIAVFLALGLSSLYISFSAPASTRNCSYKINHRAGRFVLRTVSLALRVIPPPVWALISQMIFFPGIIPGSLGLGLFNAGILARLFFDQLDHLEMQPIWALQDQGIKSLPILFYGYLPPLRERIVALILYRWEICVRATVVIGLVGVGGLGHYLIESLAAFDYPEAFLTILAFILIAAIVDLLSGHLRKKLA